MCPLPPPPRFDCDYIAHQGVAVIPKASSKERVAINAELHGFNLSAAEVAELDALERPAAESRLCWRTDPMRLLDFE